MDKIIPHGVIEDPRPPEKKAQDHLHENLYSGLPVAWIEKPQSTWRLPSQRNQDGSFSCLPQSAGSAIETVLKQIVSAAEYKLRADPTQQGMYLQNLGDILYNIGITLESVCPSQNMSDQQLDSIVLPTPTIKITGYRTFINRDMDTIAQAVQAYGHCILTFVSNSDEWQLIPVFLGTPTTFGHGICVVDFTLINGVKNLVCRDSAGQWSSPTGYRLITEDFLLKRSTGAMYFLGAKIIPPAPVVPAVPAPVIYTPAEYNWLQNLIRKYYPSFYKK